MAKLILVDAGPLVALLSSADAFHGWARETLGAMKPPLHTSEAVIAEATYLLRRVPGAPVGLLEMIARGAVEIRFRLSAEIDTVRDLMNRYRLTPMSLADASLVRMSELERDSVIVTLDRHFLTYRRNRRQRIPVLMPDTR